MYRKVPTGNYSYSQTFFKDEPMTGSSIEVEAWFRASEHKPSGIMFAEAMLVFDVDHPEIEDGHVRVTQMISGNQVETFIDLRCDDGNIAQTTLVYCAECQVIVMGINKAVDAGGLTGGETVAELEKFVTAQLNRYGIKRDEEILASVRFKVSDQLPAVTTSVRGLWLREDGSLSKSKAPLTLYQASNDSYYWYDGNDSISMEDGPTHWEPFNPKE